MGVALIHGSFEPLVYGLVITLGILSIVWKLTHGRFVAGFVEIIVFIIVFKLHGGSVTGGFAATIAALLCGLIIPFFVHSPRK